MATYADDPMSDELVELLDVTFLAAHAIAARLLELMEECGWRGVDEARADRA